VALPERNHADAACLECQSQYMATTDSVNCGKYVFLACRVPGPRPQRPRDLCRIWASDPAFRRRGQQSSAEGLQTLNLRPSTREQPSRSVVCRGPPQRQLAATPPKP
jgi:hypothetical protein